MLSTLLLRGANFTHLHSVMVKKSLCKCYIKEKYLFGMFKNYSKRGLWLNILFRVCTKYNVCLSYGFLFYIDVMQIKNGQMNQNNGYKMVFLEDVNYF